MALPGAVATAAYAIVSEAVRNVHRHAGADTCAIRLEVGGGDLVVVVADRGTGLDRTARPGVGLSSMRERAEGLGGTCTVAARPGGGTRVEARLPLAVEMEVAS